MPLLSITASEWQYQVDLTQGPGSFSASYVDNSFYASETTLNNALSTDRIQIYTIVQGHASLLGEFVVDEYSIQETDKGVTGKLSGRDSKALLLELFPGTSKTYRGMTVLSDCTITYNETAVTALRDVITRAGFVPNVNIDDYRLGQDFVHGTDTSFGDAILQLLTPQRQTTAEKYWADIYLLSTTLWVWQRDKGAPFGTVNVRYQDLIERNIEKQRPAMPTAIAVLGTQYSCFENEPAVTLLSTSGSAFEGPIPGWPWFEPYRTVSTKIVTDNVYGFDRYTITREKFYAANGQLDQAIATLVYHHYAVFDDSGNFLFTAPYDRSETWTQTYEYGGIFGNRLERFVFEKFVNDYTVKVDKNNLAASKSYISQVVKRVEVEYEYAEVPFASYAKDHSQFLIGQYHTERDANVTPLTGQPLNQAPNPAIVSLGTPKAKKTYYDNTQGQISRTAMTDDEGDDGKIVEDLAPELGVGRLPTDPSVLTPVGQRSVSRLISCGSAIPNETLSFPFVGDRDSACRIRDQINNSRQSWKVVGTFTMLPDMNIREGTDMVVTGAPSRWETTQFFIAGRSFERSVDGLIMRLTGLAWLDA